MSAKLHRLHCGVSVGGVITVFGKRVGTFRCLGSGRCNSGDWTVGGVILVFGKWVWSFVCLGVGFGYGDVSDWEVDGCINPL